MRRFQPGESVVWRSIHPTDGVAFVWARTVVADADDLIALYMPDGSPGKQRTGERGGPRGRLMVKWDGGHRDVTWSGRHALILYRPGDSHTVWMAWDARTWALEWRYINLEEPWRRTALGFDSRDLWLDLWARPDGDEWQWKDEDELPWLIEQGQLTAERATEIRAIGEQALDRVRSGGPPLDRAWESWRPDPSWLPPAMPPRWRDLRPGDAGSVPAG